MAGLIPSYTETVLPKQDPENNVKNDENPQLPLHSMNLLKLKNTTEDSAVLRAATSNVLASQGPERSYLQAVLLEHNNLLEIEKQIYVSKQKAMNARKNNLFFISLITRLREYMKRLRMAKDMAEECQKHNAKLRHFQEQLHVIARCHAGVTLTKKAHDELKRECTAKLELAKQQLAEVELAKRQLANLNSEAPLDIDSTDVLIKHAEILVKNLQAQQTNKELLLLAQTLTQSNEAMELEEHINSLINEISNKKVQEIDAKVLQKHMDAMLSLLYRLDLKYTDTSNLAEALRDRLEYLNKQPDGVDTQVNMLLDGALERLAKEIDPLKNQQNKMAEKQNHLEKLQIKIREQRETYDNVTQAIEMTEAGIVKQQEAIRQFSDLSNNLTLFLKKEAATNDQELQAEDSSQKTSSNRAQAVVGTVTRTFAGIRDTIAGAKPRENEGALVKFDELEAKIKKILPGASEEILATLKNFFREKKEILQKKLDEIGEKDSPTDRKNLILSHYAAALRDVNLNMSEALKHPAEELLEGLIELQNKKAQQVQDRNTMVDSGQVLVKQLSEALPSAVSINKQGGLNVIMSKIDTEIIQIKEEIKRIRRQYLAFEALRNDITTACQRENFATNQQE